MKPKSIKFAGMTIHEANNRLLFQLYQIYEDREAATIADLVLEHITGWKRIDRIIHKEIKLAKQKEALLEQYIIALARHKPVQYVLNEAWFAGMKFVVNEHVLIPRPETEELAEWVVNEVKTSINKNRNIVDIGTGSGCLAITIKKKLPGAIVLACDISAAALDVAKQNAALHSVEIRFIQADILDHSQWNLFPSIDIIVSNPPYIPASDKNNMHDNVLLHEPQLALFVPDDDPFIFYKAIADFANEKLQAGGKIFVEIHEDLGQKTAAIFTTSGFNNVEIKKDMQGKERMIRAVRDPA